MKRVMMLMVLAVSMLSIVGCNSVGGGKISRNPALNAAPLGLELGYADYAGFQSWLGEKLKKEKLKLDELKKQEAYKEDTSPEGEKMIFVSQKGLVDGMEIGKFLFDKSGILVYAVINRGGDINEIYKTMKSKYKLTSAEPKSGFTFTDIFASSGTYVEFEFGDTKMNLSQSMVNGIEIAYATNSFLKTVDEDQAAKSKKQKARDASNL